MKKEVLTQLDALIETGQRLIESYELKVYEYKSSVPEADLRAFVTSALAAIERIAGKNSQYYKNIPQERVLSPLAVDSLQSVTGSTLSFIPTVTGVYSSLFAMRLIKGYCCLLNPDCVPTFTTIFLYRHPNFLMLVIMLPLWCLQAAFWKIICKK